MRVWAHRQAHGRCRCAQSCTYIDTMGTPVQCVRRCTDWCAYRGTCTRSRQVPSRICTRTHAETPTRSTEHVSANKSLAYLENYGLRAEFKTGCHEEEDGSLARSPTKRAQVCVRAEAWRSRACARRRRGRRAGLLLLLRPCAVSLLSVRPRRQRRARFLAVVAFAVGKEGGGEKGGGRTTERARLESVGHTRGLGREQL